MIWNISNKYLDTFPKLVSFFSVLFLLGALWYEGLHYSFFGINIFTYISLSDAIILFLDRLFLMIVITLGILLLFTMFQLIFNEWLSKRLHFSKYNRETRRKMQINNLNLTLLIGFVPMVSFITVIPAFWGNGFKTEEFLLIRAFLFLFSIYWFFYISISYERGKYEKNYFSGKAMIITFIITFFVVIYYYHRWQVLHIKENTFSWDNNTYKLSMRDNEVINCVDSVEFIGKTKDYVFLVYPNNIDDLYSTVRVIKMEDIKEIIITKTMGWYSVFP